MLKVKKISKVYPGEDLGAVSSVSFEVNSGETVSIIGESGSGKTTLLRMVAGLMKPDSGEITFEGSPLANPEEQLIAGHDSIKMVFQDYDLMPNMSARENIGYKLLGYESAFKESRVDSLLRLCGLQELADRMPKELSGGQQQRLSLARALADEPGLLLMDEPFSSLDPISKQNLLIEVQTISKEAGVALIFVTHDTQDAMMISDRIAYMHEGQLIQMDTPEKLYRQPENIQIARFLGRLNEFDPSEAVKIGLTDLPEEFKGMAVRAEDLKIDFQGTVEVKVIDCLFLGRNYLIKTLLENGKPLVHYSDQSWTEGQTAFIEIVKENVIYFH